MDIHHQYMSIKYRYTFQPKIGELFTVDIAKEGFHQERTLMDGRTTLCRSRVSRVHYLDKLRAFNLLLYDLKIIVFN